MRGVAAAPGLTAGFVGGDKEDEPETAGDDQDEDAGDDDDDDDDFDTTGGEHETGCSSGPLGEGKEARDDDGGTAGVG